MYFKLSNTIICRANVKTTNNSAFVRVQNGTAILNILVIHLLLLSTIPPNGVLSSYQDAEPTKTAPTRQHNELRANEALELVREWASRFGRDIHFGTQEATCLRAIKDQFDPAKSDPSRRGDNNAFIKDINWNDLHGRIVDTMNTTMSWHRRAVGAIARAAEELASNHTFQKGLKYEFNDVHRLKDMSELEEALNNEPSNAPGQIPQPEDQPQDQDSGQLDANGQLIMVTGDTAQPLPEPVEPLPTPSKLEQSMVASESSSSSVSLSSSSDDSTDQWLTQTKYIKLSKHEKFGDSLVNTEESAVHVPVHIYPAEPHVMNGIAWSDGLTRVFRDNFARNQKLTNQYFASQYGFMRLFPARKWAIARTDPDLYDARMRPWYLAGASSRKDVVILVDASGSMTGTRRDIARGVVFEILDTLTDNDNFLILKFADSVQQVGVPKCQGLRTDSANLSKLPLKNIVFHEESQSKLNKNYLQNDTDIDGFYFRPANGKNIRHVKRNFTISTSGIANFSRALVAAFEVLQRQSNAPNSHLCNQAIMLITDGSPSDFSEIFNDYNVPNAPVRVFTYLIGREAGDVTHTKMMACHNRGYYTHVINLAEVRETVQQYIPVMARPLVLNGTHPVTWTPAYGELTYQILTDWVWENRRRHEARAILNAAGRGSGGVRVTASSDDPAGSPSATPVVGVYSNDYESGVAYESDLEDELEAIDLFGYNSNPDCFWEQRQNDLLTTVVQPVYDLHNESVITERFLMKNNWTTKETVMRTAQLLGVAAADMKIKDVIALAPSHKLGPNGYAIMLTNNGFVVHHPDLRSILEPFSATDEGARNMRILKPFFSSMDFTHLEHIQDPSSDSDFLELRKKAVEGQLIGYKELVTKRTVDCKKRVQTRRQTFYYKPLKQYPFSIMIAIPQPYGSHRLEAQLVIKRAQQVSRSGERMKEKLSTYFTNSDYDIWTIHPEYDYCDGPANKTVSTLLDVLQRVEDQPKLEDVQWRPAESKEPPVAFANKIVCDRDLVQSLIYDAVATFDFLNSCGLPSPSSESTLFNMFGVRFSFVATRSGLTRVRHYEDDTTVKKEALAFARKHNRAIDETFYSRTVDYNMLINENATLLQVPFNTHEKIKRRLENWDMSQIDNSDPSIIEPRMSVRDMSLSDKLRILTNHSIHVIATQSIIVNEGKQQAIAGVAGVFYDYATFVQRFFNSTNAKFDQRPVTKSAACYTGTSTDESCDESKAVRCGYSNDTYDCLLVDNNGYILISEDLNYIGRHLKAYDANILSRLVRAKVFHEVNVTDYQAVCMLQEEVQFPSSGNSLLSLGHSSVNLIGAILANLISAITVTWTLLAALVENLATAHNTDQATQFQQQSVPILSLLPNKTYLRPCMKIQTLYETRRVAASSSSRSAAEHYKTRCNCDAWFVHEQMPDTNLIVLIVDTNTECRQGCDLMGGDPTSDPTDSSDLKHFGNKTNEELACLVLERESQLYRKHLDSCFKHHPDEEHIKLCGAAAKSAPISHLGLIIMIFISLEFMFTQHL